ncbi:MAG TPA: AMP-binding protein [Gemmatimonadales bacterium]|nr:AMP-binding protein [Gemmatimonadales bacterium]
MQVAYRSSSAADEGSFANLLWQAGERFATRTAMLERGQETTYASVLERGAGVARALANAGVQPGDRVAVLLKRGPEAAATLFGTLAVGAIIVPVNKLYQPRQIEYVVRDSGSRVLIASAELLGALSRPLDIDVPILDVADLPITGSFDPVLRSAQDPAQIIYTSGSTGQPKGVLSSHANLWAGVRTVLSYLPIRETDRVASLLPFSFVYGFNQLTSVLATGATLVVERSSLAAEIATWLFNQDVTVVAGVPPLWMQLLANRGFRERRFPSLRILTNAGGRLAPDAVVQLRQAQPQADLYLMYGLTEVFRSTCLPPNLVDAHPDSIGKAVPGAEVYVVREDGSRAEPGEVGELVHAGPTVALGYWQNPHATERTFRANQFASDQRPELARAVFSGDLVRADADGLLYYVARRDRMIKTLGYRVSPDEIEDVLFSSGQILESVVVGRPDPKRGDGILAYVVLRPEGTLEAVRQYCATELPRYMWPSRFEVLDAIPRSPAGKFDYVQLRRRAAEPPPVASA